MPYDPNFPTANTLADAVQVRAQFNGLKDLIDAGVPGPQGPQGPQGPPGEVTNAALVSAIATAIAGTSNNTNAIPTLDTAFPDPDMETLRQAYNALVLGLRR